MYFFFYNNLKNIDYIKNISEIFTIYDTYIYITSYDKNSNKLLIDNNDDYKIQFNGKLVFFPMNTIEEIIKKLSTMNILKNNNISCYNLEKIKVFKSDNDYITKAYILY
jgi:hypothetical protein